MTACACDSTQPACPRTALDMLCTATGVCYDSDYYQTTTCAVDACGRWATDEASYRAARRACNLNFDAAWSVSAPVAATLVAAAASLLLPLLA